jgi:hypothetical protein
MTDYSNLYTAFISCSPRLSDSKDVGLKQIYNCVNSIRNELGFKNTIIYVIFDGIKGRPADFGQQEIINYNLKKQTFKDHPDIINNKLIKIIEFDDWRHQANTLKNVMTTYTKTPLVFSIQEDSLILNGKDIDMNLITDKLLNDPIVEYVKLFIHKDLSILPGQERHGRSVPGDLRPETLPATPHHDTDLLHHCKEWSDRPHFATLDHYNNRVWPKIQPNFRCTMEQEVKFSSIREDTQWNLWIYGKRYNMQHECDIAYINSGLGCAYHKKGTHRN